MKSHLKTCWLTTCASGWLTLASPGAPGQATPPPLVRTTVQIESSLLRDNLDPGELDRVSKELAEYVAQKLPTPGFEYMRWMPPQTQPELPPAAEFRVVIRQKSSGGIPRLTLEYQAFVGGQQVAMPSVAPQAIYEGPAPSVHSAERLISDIKSLRLDKDFPNEDFRRHLTDEFVHGISLSEQVIVEQGKMDIIVPLDYEALHASDQSHLYVEFTAQPDEQPAESGSMRLRPMRKVSNGAFQGSVDCRVYTFEFRDVSVPEPGGNDPRVVVILTPPSVKSAHVFMEKFEKRTGTLFLTPNP